MPTTLLNERILKLHHWEDPHLASIKAPGVDLAIINRAGFPSISADDIAGLRAGSYRAEVDRQTAHATITNILVELGIPNHAALAADMSAITEQFLQLTGVQWANLRIDLADRQNCPKMHCDARQIRLITTYCGATTEYCDANQPSDIKRLNLGAIALLKGTTHPTHQGEYVLHRSPSVCCGERRLCLVLDY